MEKIPDPKDIEKDISDFLTKKYGGAVRMITPVVLPHTDSTGDGKKPSGPEVLPDQAEELQGEIAVALQGGSIGQLDQDNIKALGDPAKEGTAILIKDVQAFILQFRA